MKNALFFMLDDYADWEGAYLASMINQQAGWQVKTASLEKEVQSIGGFTTVVDYTLETLPETIDLLILIGGNSWHLNPEKLVTLVADLLEANIPVGAICGAVDFLARNGLLTHYQHTGNALFFWQEFTEYTNASDFKEEQAVSDKLLITANGTATLEFTKLVLEAINFTDENQIKQMIGMHQLGYYKYTEKFGNPYL